MQSKFQHNHEHEERQLSGAQSESSVEFATSDEMLRQDREQNPPPPEIAERLNQSLANEPKKGTTFWAKLGFRK